MMTKQSYFAQRLAQRLTSIACLAGLLVLTSACSDSERQELLNLLEGNDLNSANNAVVQPQPDARSGGGRDQSLKFGDVLQGSSANDLLIGGIGIDFLIGNGGDDVMVGGTEDFNPENRDRAFGGPGNDVFIWSPGDGSDYYNGGPGAADVIIFGLLAEQDANGGEKFTVEQDQNFDGLSLTNAAPKVDVAGSPGFCEVVDSSSRADAAARLAELRTDKLVRFNIRGVRNAFENGDQNTDNGLRVTISMLDVEFVVCTARAGGAIEVLDLRATPPVATTLSALPQSVQDLVM